MKPLIGASIIFVMTLFAMNLMFAHCDTMNGPVVKAAKNALEKGNVNLVLIWVQPRDEAIIKQAFERTMKIRSVSPQAKEMADMYFFETLVRIHRAGEGASYTGLKPAATGVELGIDAADKAIEQRSTDEVLADLIKVIREGIAKQFNEVNETRDYKTEDVERGRRYVKEYVEFIHYVERLFQDASQRAEGHHHENETEPAVEHH